MSAGFDRPGGPPGMSRSEVLGSEAMVATSQPLATPAAIEILRQGGTAVDAAIAANAVLGVVEPTGAGIGGDLFALVWDARTERLSGLNASGRSPRALGLGKLRAMGLGRMPADGPLSVSVPGAVDGWFELGARFGRLPMATLLAPAIGYAKDGFPVSPLIAAEWAREGRRLQAWPGFAETFLPAGRAPAAGERFRNPRLAESYARLVREGRDGFYQGSLARTIAAYLGQHGGHLAEEDLAAHRSEWVEPVSTDYRGCTVWQLPPNGQGIAVIQMLNLLEGFDLAGMGFATAEYLHHLVEAKKLAYEDRARFYADPAFARVPVNALCSKQYAAGRRALLDPAAAAAAYPPGVPESGDTVCLSVGDADGNMISLMQSNYHGMGSGMTPGDLGFVLQNRGELFSLEEGHANVYAPGKRPFHTIIPGFVTREGRPWLAFGVMGAGMQPQGQVQILANLLDFGMGLQAAGDAPRARHEGSSEPTGEQMRDGGRLYLETAIGAGVRAQLERMGHRLAAEPGFFGGYQAVLHDAALGCYVGASDPRKDGQAAGY